MAPPFVTNGPFSKSSQGAFGVESARFSRWDFAPEAGILRRARPPLTRGTRVTFSIALFVVALVLVLLGWLLRRNRLWAIACANLAAIVGALALFETYVDYQQAEGDGTRLEGSITNGFTHADDVLGYAPNANAKVTARKLYGESVIYDVTYTTDAHGLRVTAPPAASAKECVVFFGDSITFGEGVPDTETFPYLVSQKAAERYATYNFGFSGYGAHQMLAALQSGRLDRVVQCMPKYIVYLCIPDHAARVAGLDSWDRHGPRFRLQPDRSVMQQGHFDDPDPASGSWAAAWAQKALASSLIWQKFFSRPYKIDAQDIALLDGVILEAARLAQERLPGSKFDVILWDGGNDEQVRLIEQGLAESNVHLSHMTDAVTDFYTRSDRYILSTHDRHPNATWHRMMADYIFRELLHETPAVPSK
jgi:hypothetical protein